MIDLITGHQGVAHISADQIASINNAMMDNYGANKVMRLVGGELTANGLTIEVGTGYWRANGFDMEVQEAETIYIDPTAAGLSRIDNIYVEILQDIPTGAQRSEIVTVNGEPSATPTAPEAPTAPELNTDILLQVVPLASVTVTEGAMVMTDLTIAYEMVTPSELEAVETIATGAQTTASNAQEAAGNAQTTANTASTNATNALNMIRSTSLFPTGDAYSTSRSYSVGNLVIYNNALYRCKTACSAGSWSANRSNFELTTLAGEITDLNSALSKTSITPTLASGYSFNHYKIASKNNRVVINALFTTPSSNIPAGYQIKCFSIPSSYAPSKNIWGSCYVLNGNGSLAYVGGCYIASDGNVYYSIGSDHAGPLTFALSITYDID
jgi:hypothetical protein